MEAASTLMPSDEVKNEGILDIVVETKTYAEDSVAETEESIEEIEESKEEIQESLTETQESSEKTEESEEDTETSMENSEKLVEESQESVAETESVEEASQRGRAEPISKYNILKISGTTDRGVKKFETISSSSDKVSYTTKNTYQREGLTIDIERRGSVGDIRETTPDCEITQIGAPYDVEYDAYGGLVEWSTTKSIKITNPDISELHIQYVIYTTYGSGGNRRIIKRDIYIPLADSRTEAPQSPQIVYNTAYPDSYVLTGTDSSMEYAITTSPFIKSSFTWEPCTGEDMILTPTNASKIYLIRYKTTDSGSESKYKELTLPARDLAPAISFNKENEVLSGLTTAMEYSINGGEYTAVTEPIVESVSSIIDGITETNSVEMKVRVRPDNKPAGFERMITLYKRFEKPSGVTFDLATFTLKGTKSGMEYKLDTEGSWRAISSTTVSLERYASAEKEVTLQVRYKATNTNAHSGSVTFTIPKLLDAPTGLAINYLSESITGFDTAKGYEYARSSSGSYSKITLTETGEFLIDRFISTSSPITLYIREAVTEEKPYSSYAQISIPARKRLQGTKFVYNDENTPETQALLQGVNTSMEYRLASENTWYPVLSETMAFDIPTVSTAYQIREKATQVDFMSSEYPLTLKKYQFAPSCKLSSNEYIYSVNNKMEYRKNGGKFNAVGDITSLPLTEIVDSLSGNETCLMEFRYMRTVYDPVGVIKAFTIKPRPSAPVNLTYDVATYTLSGVSKDMQYREIGTASWRTINNVTINLKTLVEGRTDVQIEVRYKPVTANNVIFASYPTVVNLY